jgi:hypothetical protein
MMRLWFFIMALVSGFGCRLNSDENSNVKPNAEVELLDKSTQDTVSTNDSIYNHYRKLFISGLNGADNMLFERPNGLYKIVLHAFEQDDPFLSAKHGGKVSFFDSTELGIGGKKFYYKDMLSKVELNSQLVDDFFSVVNDTGIYHSTATCFYPHHGFYLMDSLDNVVSYYEVCFKCDNMKSFPSFHEDQVGVSKSGLSHLRQIINRAGIDSRYFNM